MFAKLNKSFRTLRQHPFLSLTVALIFLTTNYFLGLFFWGKYHLHRAEDLISQENFSEAQSHLTQALWARGSDPDIYLRLARVERQLEHYAEAEKALQKAIALRGKSSESDQLEWVLLRAYRGEYDEVKGGLWNCILANHPDQDHIFQTMVSVSLRQRDYAETMDILDFWLEKEPNSVNALHRRASVHDFLNHREAALADFDRAIELAPGRDDIRLQLIDLLLYLQKIELVKKQVDYLVERTPNRNEVLYALAQLCVRTGKNEQAKKALAQLISQKPDFAAAYVLRGKLELESENFAEAEPFLQQAVNLNPHDPEAQYTLGQVLTRIPDRLTEGAEHLKRSEMIQKDFARAGDLIRKDLPASPNNVELIIELAQIYFRVGQDKEAIMWLFNGLKWMPQQPEIHRILAEYYQRIGDLDKEKIHRKYAGS